MVAEGLFPGPGNGISCVRFLSDEALVHFDIPVLLQVDQVRGQVTVGHFQHLLQVIEVNLRVHHQDAHHPQAHAVVEYFIQSCNRVLHYSSCLHKRSG